MEFSTSESGCSQTYGSLSIGDFAIDCIGDLVLKIGDNDMVIFKQGKRPYSVSNFSESYALKEVLGPGTKITLEVEQ